MTTYKAKYIVTEEGVIEDGVLSVIDGQIHSIGSGHGDVDLGDVALTSGLVNGHSHAFQRIIRGRTEFLDAARPHEDFWSWRTQMYRAAGRLDPESIEIISRMTFLEMAMTGITEVGEFHYIHHQADGTSYTDPNELSHRVIAAARAVGLRITLLKVAYHRGGFGRPASPDQRRFIEADVDTYLTRADALRRHYADDDLINVGLAPHSIRAVPGHWLNQVAQYSEESGCVVHIHACEQRRELEESVAEYGLGPVPVFAERGLLNPRTTLVHGTHLTEDDLSLLERHRPTICACPTTERNLGDGFLPATALSQRRVPISLGSDSQAQIDLWADARLVEYHERLLKERRNVLATTRGVWFDDAAHRLETADVLWPMLNANGARSLGTQTGALSVGRPADFISIDLEDLSIAGATAQTLKSDLVFSLQSRAVRDVFVEGESIIREGIHPLHGQIIGDFRRVVSRL
jgi:formimidoylglutamate deiminase